MLEYALELEGKMRDSRIDAAKVSLVLCGDAFRWHEDELEDFVAFYHAGQHRRDDPFGKMEAHHIRTNNVMLKRTISGFGFMERSQFDILPRRLTWQVRPPETYL